ncbi:MAG: hypothetical protein DHS20C14_08310 [Phycisphaeraceae bacterium]|nr:MAG: hypothetical protein DHS20C14_08310 [Phycisphaeraceae bacterium]
MQVANTARLGRKMLCGAAIGALAGSAHAQTDVFWADPVDGVWSNSGAWSPAGGPGQLDNAIIDALGKTGYTVTLDVAGPTVANFELTSSVATFNLNDNAIGTTADLVLSSGTIRGNSSAAGAFFVGGGALMTNATLRDMNQFAVLGDSTLTGMQISDIASFDIGPNGTMTVSDTAFVNVGMVNNSGDMTLDTGGGSILSIDDTCVGNGKNMSWTGAGTIAMNGDGEIMNAGGSAFRVVDGGGSMEGNGKSNARFMNDGSVEQIVTSRTGAAGLRGSSATRFSQMQFINNGSVTVGFGAMSFAEETGVTDDNQLFAGKWTLFGNSTLTFEDQQINAIIGGAEVNVSGAGSTFTAVESLTQIGGQSAFRISNGYDFQTFDQFTNNGFLGVGFDSEFDVMESGLSNLSNSILTGGTYEVEGTLMLPGDSQIQFLEADVTLIGADSVLTGIDKLEIVGSQGAFALEQGRAFTTDDDFLVIQGGRVRVGLGSMLDVSGQLVNFNSGIFDDGFFEIQGVLRAPGLVINEISNELILDGVSSQFIDEQGADAMAGLTRIQTDGILRLRGGRTLDNLDSLIVDGILEIDPFSGRAREESGPGGGAQLSTAGDFVVNPGAELIMVLGGTTPGDFASITVGNDALLGGDSGEGGTLRLVIARSYDAKAGDEFVLLRALGVVNGDFSDVQVVGLGAGLAIEVDVLAQMVVARVTPTPATAAVLALAGITATRRRRR